MHKNLAWADKLSESESKVARQVISLLRQVFGGKPKMQRCGTCRWFKDRGWDADFYHGSCYEKRRRKLNGGKKPTRTIASVACCVWESVKK